MPRVGFRQQPGGHDALLAVLPPGRGWCWWSRVSPPSRGSLLWHTPLILGRKTTNPRKSTPTSVILQQRGGKKPALPCSPASRLGLDGWEGPPAPITCQLSCWHYVLSWQCQRPKLRLEKAAFQGRRCKEETQDYSQRLRRWRSCALSHTEVAVYRIGELPASPPAPEHLRNFFSWKTNAAVYHTALASSRLGMTARPAAP